MKNTLIITTLSLMWIAGFALAKDKAPAPAKPEAITLAAADVKYGPPPPVLRPGAQLAVLHGDPGKNGPFSMRVKMPDGYTIAPHWHSNDEELTVISGTFVLAMGDKPGENTHALEAGAYHFLPGKMHHSASAKGEVVVEVHGIGPFDLHYLNPADDPSKAVEAKR